MADQISIAIIEDNPLLREGLAALLDPQPDIAIVAIPGNSGNVLQFVRDAQPKVVLLDIGLRFHNSLHLVKTLKREMPESRVIVMDLLPMQADILAYIEAGITGFIMKDATLDELLNAIRLAANGEHVLPGQLTGSLFYQIVNHSLRNRRTDLLRRAVRMTNREKDVVMLVAEGFTNKEIAARLHLSLYTVKSHIHNILEKLSLHTRVQIARFVHEDRISPSRSLHPGDPGSPSSREEN